MALPLHIAHFLAQVTEPRSQSPPSSQRLCSECQRFEREVAVALYGARALKRKFVDHCRDLLGWEAAPDLGLLPEDTRSVHAVEQGASGGCACCRLVRFSVLEVLSPNLDSDRVRSLTRDTLSADERDILDKTVPVSNVAEIRLRCHQAHRWDRSAGMITMRVWLKINGVATPVFANAFMEAGSTQAAHGAARPPLGKSPTHVRTT